jgi:hypothetical protein
MTPRARLNDDLRSRLVGVATGIEVDRPAGDGDADADVDACLRTVVPHARWVLTHQHAGSYRTVATALGRISDEASSVGSIHKIHVHNNVVRNLKVSNILPPFIFSCGWIVQFCTIQRQLKRNGWSI